MLIAGCIDAGEGTGDVSGTFRKKWKADTYTYAEGGPHSDIVQDKTMSVDDHGGEEVWFEADPELLKKVAVAAQQRGMSVEEFIATACRRHETRQERL